MSVAPRTWLLLAEKQGDNAQVEALAGSLPWPCETRRLAMQERWLQGKPPVAASLDHLDLAACDELAPPWPDLIVTMGRRTANAAFWIREQAKGRTKIVLVGKPSGWLERFDLVVGSAEVQLPPFDNVASIGLPLLRVDPADVAKAADAWRAEMADWPRPLVAVLVGGPTGPFAFDRAVRERLVRLVRSVRERGGTPFVTTSRRTPGEVADALEAALPEGGHLFRWSPEAPRNPYRALLGLADGFAVTGDSISMLVEVARLRRPLAIVPLSTGPLGALDQRRRAFTRWLFARPGADGKGRLRAAVARGAFRAGLLTHTRDFNALHEWMVETGLAVWTDGELPAEGFPAPSGDVDDDLNEAAARVAALFEGPGR
ncbi:MAG: mitochondrial fission ELM1 family protein [Myxococcota bacterium]